MDARTKKQIDKFKNDVWQQVAEFEELPKDDDRIIRMMRTPDSMDIMARNFYEWRDKDTREGWSRQKMMKYGALVAARNIVMSKMAVYD